MDGTLTTAVYVPKGGVAKSTTAAEMAVSLEQDHGLDTVLVDLAGTQNDLSNLFGLTERLNLDAGDPDENEIELPINLVFRESWSDVEELVDDPVPQMTFATGDGPDLIPADPGLGGAKNELTSVPLEERFVKLKRFVDQHLAQHYQAVVIDLPGSDQDTIAISGLAAAEHVVAPLPIGAFEQEQLHNLGQQLKDISAEKELPATVELSMVIPTRVNRSKRTQIEWAEDVIANHEVSADTFVPESQPLQYLQMHGEPQKPDPLANDRSAGSTVRGYDGDLPGTAQDARRAYRQATSQLVERLSSEVTA